MAGGGTLCCAMMGLMPGFPKGEQEEEAACEVNPEGQVGF